MKKIKYIILIIVGVIILLSSCSLFPSEIDRNLFFDSICWEDDSHILMYTMVRKWVNTTTLSITGESGYWDWSKGEIWRINVFTGEKELLLRREGDYYTGLSTVVKIDILGDRKLISLDGNAYIMEGESADWQEIKGIYEAEWVNENEIIGIEEETDNIIKYNINNQSITFRASSYSSTLFHVYLKNYSNAYQAITNAHDLYLIRGDDLIAHITENDTFRLNDSLFSYYYYLKPYEVNDNIYVMTELIQDHSWKNYLIEFDTTLTVKSMKYCGESYLCPRGDMEIFAKYGSTNKIEFIDKENNIISKSIFITDQLD